MYYYIIILIKTKIAQIVQPYKLVEQTLSF